MLASSCMINRPDYYFSVLYVTLLNSNRVYNQMNSSHELGKLRPDSPSKRHKQWQTFWLSRVKPSLSYLLFEILIRSPKLFNRYFCISLIKVVYDTPLGRLILKLARHNKIVIGLIIK